jgi:hypothetical protein
LTALYKLPLLLSLQIVDSVPYELNFSGKMCGWEWEALFPLLSTTMPTDNNIPKLEK